jgi:hypothetical protein
MSKNSFLFATNVANEYGYSPQFKNIENNLHQSHLTLVNSKFLMEKCKFKLQKFLILLKTPQLSNIRMQSHSPHLKGNSPHVASGEWWRNAGLIDVNFIRSHICI